METQIDMTKELNELRKSLLPPLAEVDYSVVEVRLMEHYLAELGDTPFEDHYAQLLIEGRTDFFTGMYS